MTLRDYNIVGIAWRTANHDKNGDLRVIPSDELKSIIIDLIDNMPTTFPLDPDERAENLIKYTDTHLAEELWKRFGDVPMNPETECIEEEWNGFPADSFREDIWHWFEETFNISVAVDLMHVG